MNEIFYNLTHPLPNAVTTAIMGVLAVYWLFTFLSGIGFEDVDLGFDFDVDVDAPDMDVDADVDADGAGPDDVQAGESPGFFMRFLQFMNIGRVPFMLVLSTFKFFLWVGTLFTTQLINVGTWGLTSLFILVPLAVVSVFFTRFATNPMVRFF
ncbi:MAG: YqiJ family protein [Tannerellaceae bacterium]|nr:YqiJ family protein [Tannerellaceae bacterium]